MAGSRFACQSVSKIPSHRCINFPKWFCSATHGNTVYLYYCVSFSLSLSLGLREFEAKRIAINRSRFAVVVSTTTAAVVVMAVVLVPKPLKTIHNLRAHILYSVRIVLSVALIRINKNFPFSFGSRLPRAYDKERI